MNRISFICLILIPLISYAGFKEVQRVVIDPDPRYDNYDRREIAYSGTLKSVAYPVKKGDKVYISVNGRLNETPYDCISTISFLPQTEKVVFLASRDGCKTLFWVMGEGKEFSKFPASKGRGFAYSKFLNKFVYIGTEENKDLIVEDGEPSKRRFERIDFVSFLPDQKTIVYKAKEKESEFLVVGGKEHKRYRMIRDIRFSDSSDIYYLATDGRTEFLVINGREQQRFAGGVYYYCLSKDGRRVITIGNDRKNILVTVDNKTERFPLMKRTRALFCRFAPDSSGYAFLAPDRENPDNTALFINGTKIGVYSEILWSSNPESVVFSPDSTKFAYVVREGNKETLYINDRKLATHDRFYKVLFSPDSEHIVYSYQDRDEAIGFSIGLDGKALRSISSLSESPDGPPFIFDGSDRVRYIYEDNSGFYYVEEVIN